jgi:hypothetical protein
VNMRHQNYIARCVYAMDDGLRNLRH